MAKKTPEYIKFEEGKATVTLSRQFEMGGAKVGYLTMREPTVNDQLIAEKSGTGGDADVAYMANLCMVAPDDIKRLPLRDFQRLQAAFRFFID